MSGQVPDDIRRGRMSEDEIAAIADLAARGFCAGRIAQKLNRHPSTVSHHMAIHGLREVKQRRDRSYLRNGVLVRGFSEVEDAFITGLRIQGLPISEIARACTQRFGHPRQPHTINYRLRLLATLSEAGDE